MIGSKSARKCTALLTATIRCCAGSLAAIKRPAWRSASSWFVA